MKIETEKPLTGNRNCCMRCTHSSTAISLSFSLSHSSFAHAPQLSKLFNRTQRPFGLTVGCLAIKTRQRWRLQIMMIYRSDFDCESKTNACLTFICEWPALRIGGVALNAFPHARLRGSNALIKTRCHTRRHAHAGAAVCWVEGVAEERCDVCAEGGAELRGACNTARNSLAGVHFINFRHVSDVAGCKSSAAKLFENLRRSQTICGSFPYRNEACTAMQAPLPSLIPPAGLGLLQCFAYFRK